MTDFEAKLEGGSLVPVSETSLPLVRFPPLQPGTTRPIYFDFISDADRAELTRRGYYPRMLMELPRGTPAAEAEYLLAKAQAMEEGTVPCDKQMIDAVELQMKANRMLGNNNFVARLDVKAGRKDVVALMESWSSSRHTLRGNTTITPANEPLKETSSTGRGRKKKGK